MVAEFINRMVTEKQELDEKKMKLFNFMTTTEYQSLTADEKFLLGVQYNAMCIYSIVLFKRINFYKHKNNRKNNGNNNKKII